VSGFDGILGQATAIDQLRRMLERQRVPQALLFQGPEGVGKALTAHAFTAALLCTGDGPAGCGGCHACHLLESGNHPDLTLVQRQPKKDRPSELSSFITVDQIRGVSHLAGQAPRQGRRRVFIVDPAERMNTNAQNALLKTLEEPPERALIILVAARPHLLLPTVRSRCFAVGFAALASEELARLLEQRGIDPDQATIRAALAEGRPGRALGLDIDAVDGRRREVLEALERLVGAPTEVAELPAMATRLAGKDETSLTEGLDLLQGLLRDAARAAGDGKTSALVHADLAARLEQLGQRLGPQRAAAIVTSIDRLRGGLRFNLNRVLIAESLLAAVAGGPVP